MRTGQDILNGIRRRNQLPDDAEIGVVSSFGRDCVFKQHARSRDVEIVVNTDDIDSDDEVVLPSGADDEYFRKNKNRIFGDHNYSLLDVVGHAREKHPNGSALVKYPSAMNHRGWKMTVGLMQNPLADAVTEILKATGSIGASVGFRVKSYRRPTDEDKRRFVKGGEPERIIDSWSLLEVSLTAMPANVNCQGRLTADEKWMGEMDDMLCKGTIRRESASMLGFPDGKLKRVLVWR